MPHLYYFLIIIILLLWLRLIEKHTKCHEHEVRNLSTDIFLNISLSLFLSFYLPLYLFIYLPLYLPLSLSFSISRLNDFSCDFAPEVQENNV